MSSTYGLILVLLTLVCGVVWLFDALTAGKARKAALNKLYEHDPEPSEEAIEAITKEPIHVDYAKSFFPILLFIVVLRSFLYEPFQIPSASMKPTLVEGDFILVNKYNYGLRLPVTSDKVVDIGQPKRGDVAVFRAPHTGEDFIKRVVGLPGDTVYYTIDKQLYIKPACDAQTEAKNQCIPMYSVKRELVTNEPYVDRDPESGLFSLNEHYREWLGDNEHEILINPTIPEGMKQYRGPAPELKLPVKGSYSRVSTHVYQVPEGHYFVMGDNRDNSDDGRYWPGTNFVPEENLVGQAVAIWLHLDFELKSKPWSSIPTGVDFGRVGEIK